jgi:RND family efflux transporter MFP subunit
MKHHTPTLLLSLTLLATGCSRSHGPAAAAPALPSARVHVATARLESVAASIEATGTVRAARHAWIAARVMGTIEELPVLLGQRVRRGDLIARLAAGEISARLAQTQAQVAYTQRELDRERDLLAKGAGTAESVRSLEDRLRLAVAARQEAEAMASYTDLRAPFDGAVSRRLVKAGDLASPGQPLLEIEGDAGLEIEAMLPESATTGLKVGQRLPVMRDDLRFSAEITEIAAAADSATRTVESRLTVPAGTAVRPGQFVRVLLPSASSRAVVVPATAVTLHGQMERVFVAGADGRAVLRLVRSGRVEGDRVIILAGLNENDRVVTDPSATLREGQPLEVLP